MRDAHTATHIRIACQPLLADTVAHRSAVPLRNAVAKLTGLRFTPELLFRRQAVHKDELETEAAWLMLEQERLEESAAAAPRETEVKDTKN